MANYFLSKFTRGLVLTISKIQNETMKNLVFFRVAFCQGMAVEEMCLHYR